MVGAPSSLSAQRISSAKLVGGGAAGGGGGRDRGRKVGVVISQKSPSTI